MFNFLKSIVESLLIFLLLTIFIYPQQEPEYEILRIGGRWWISKAVNDQAEVVGYDVNLPSEDHLPFIWENGQATYLAHTGYANAYDINNNSQITGSMSNAQGYWMPVIWTTLNTYITISLPIGFSGGGNAINNNTDIGGTIMVTYDSLRRGFIYDNGLYVIPEQSGCLSDIYDINDQGIAVGFRVCEDTIFNSFTLQNGIITNYGAMFGFSKINNAGHIAGKTRNSPYRAVKLINNIPYYVNNGIYIASGANSINDSSIMAGWAYLAGMGLRAVIFENDQIIDLNNFVPPDSNIILTEAKDINNYGDVLVTGYYPPDQYETFHWLLRKPRTEITHPSKRELFVSGSKDSVMWTGGKANQQVDIKYSLDGGNSWEAELIAENIPADTGKWHWVVPDELYSRKALIRITDHTTNEAVIESDTFRIKPLIITKLDQNGNYVAYDIDTDRWGFGNYPDKMWPPWYYSRFDYLGVDPFTGYQYDLFECGGVFYLADPKDFPDWESFVNAFSVEACYRRITPPITYSLTALERWAAKKKNWNGSCFGIAASNALVFERRTDYVEKFPDVSSFINPINLTQPDTGDISAITTLFSNQFGNPSIANDGISYDIKTPNQTLFEIIEMLKEDSVKIKTLTIYNNNGPGAHTILPYQVVHFYNATPQIFYIMVYDNSYPNLIDADISIDTSANSGDGDWSVSYGEHWIGTKNIYLEIPSRDYLNPATLNKNFQFQSPFILKQNELEINNTTDASIIIKDNSNNITGFQNNQVFSDIPGSRPLMIKNGSENPPYGYYLQTDNYEIEMSDFTTTKPSLFLFTDNKSFSVKREDALQTQTDKISYWSENRLEINNPDNELKSFQLTEIINESEKEKMYILRNIDMNQNDLIEIINVDADNLKFTNNGSQKNYEIELQFVNDNGLKRFLNSSVNLPVTSNHTVLPNWNDITNTELMILVDDGNDGTIDDTLHLENEVTGMGEDQGSLIPTEYRLEQNYPNPFNNSTVIRYAIPKEGLVTLKVYNVIGEEVTTIVNEIKQAGNYQVTFNSDKLTSGVYLYKLTSGGFTETKKMIQLK